MYGKRLLYFFAVIIIIYLGFAGYWLKNSFNPSFLYSAPIITPTVTSAAETVTVTRVIDGDTIEIEGGERVRYIGINTPETVDPRQKVQCFGREASEKNRELVAGKKVRLERDVSEWDKYKRLLRYVYVNETFVNLELVKQGFALTATFPPDVKYQKLFLEAEKEARENKRGLWKSCPIKN